MCWETKSLFIDQEYVMSLQTPSGGLWSIPSVYANLIGNFPIVEQTRRACCTLMCVARLPYATLWTFHTIFITYYHGNKKKMWTFINVVDVQIKLIKF